MYRFRRTIHDHLHFIVVVGILLVVMTYPTIVYVFNTDVFLAADRQRRHLD